MIHPRWARDGGGLPLSVVEERPGSATSLARASGAPTPLADGCVPYRVWIGVTGHRDIRATPELIERVREVLRGIDAMLPVSGVTPIHTGVVSALAEGADQLVARLVLEQPGTALAAVLPLPADRYAEDFEDPAARAGFHALLDRADLVTVSSSAAVRETAYRAAGIGLVEHCDVVVALWDGNPSRGPGGTAEIIERARARELPLFWIDPAPPHEVRRERADRLPLTGLADLEAYNRERVDEQVIRAGIAETSERLVEDATLAGLSVDTVRALTAVIVPPFVRSDLLAHRSQRLFLRLGTLLFVAAALAVAVSAAQVNFWPHRPRLALIESLLMVLLLGLLVFARRHHLHLRWICYRTLAERLRGAVFLEATRTGRREAGSEGSGDPGPGMAWVDRSIEEVLLAAPHPPPPDPAAIRRFVVRAWIEDQIAYFLRVVRRLGQRERLIGTVMAVLFGLTLLAAALHAAAMRDLEGWPTHVLTFAILALPAAAGSLAGIRAQREYTRNADRARRMVERLTEIRRRLQAAATPAALLAEVEEASALMMDEHHDWYGTVRFRDLELHV